MKKKIFKVLFVIAVFVFSIKAGAQVINPVHWSFSAVKTGADTYEIHLTATVDRPWHVYAQENEKDGPIPTTVTFKTNPFVIVEKQTVEAGKLVSKHEEAFGMVVRYYEDKVDFVKKVRMRRKVNTNIAGSVHYMTCNDQKCLPAATVPFNIKLN